jgi:hypothetical protein
MLTLGTGVSRSVTQKACDYLRSDVFAPREWCVLTRQWGDVTKMFDFIGTDGEERM